MTINWEPLWDIIQQHQRFVLTSHVRPDADALGSELGMAALLEGLGKEVRIVNPSSAPPTLDFLDPEQRVFKIGEGITPAEILDTDVHMILDTSAWSQLNEIGTLLKKTKAVKVVIDHHMSSDSLGAVEFKDTTSEATGSLVYLFAQKFNLPISPIVAEQLYCAIATDTGWFRFSSTSSQTMRIIADLIDLGASPHLIYEKLYEQRSLARVKLSSRILSGVQMECDGELGWISVKWSDFVETGAKPVDTEDLVNEVLHIQGTKCAFIAVEQQNKQIKFSLRSRTDVNVAAVAEQFGGGGHKQAAGTLLPGPLVEAVAKVLSAMRNAL